MEAEIQAGGTIVVQDVAKRRNAPEMELLHWLFDNYELTATIVRRKPGAKPYAPSAGADTGTAELAECNRKNAEYIAKLEACTAKCVLASGDHVRALERENAELKRELAKAMTAPEQDGPPPALPERDDDEAEFTIPAAPPLPPAVKVAENKTSAAATKSARAVKALEKTARETPVKGSGQDLAATLAQTMAARRRAVAGNDEPDNNDEWSE